MSSASVPSLGAVNVYQSETPPGAPACSGSPSSTLASSFDCVTVPALPLSGSAEPKRSFADASDCRHESVNGRS